MIEKLDGDTIPYGIAAEPFAYPSQVRIVIDFSIVNRSAGETEVTREKILILSAGVCDFVIEKFKTHKKKNEYLYWSKSTRKRNGEIGKDALPNERGRWKIHRVRDNVQ